MFLLKEDFWEIKNARGKGRGVFAKKEVEFTTSDIQGFLSLIKPITIKAATSFYSLIFFMILLFGLVLIFYRSDRRLTRPEGIVLLFIYLTFLISEISWMFFID